MVDARIKCSVDTCRYWGSGNRCEADSIMVAVDGAAGGGERLEAGVAGGGAAHRSSETKCDTFRPS